MPRITIDHHERDEARGLNMIYYQGEGVEGLHVHVFPDDTLDWRCAEFDYDPSDVETLIETILAERWEQPVEGEIRSQPLSQRSQNKRTRVQQVGLVISDRGAKWQSAIAAVRRPELQRVAAFRSMLNDRGPEGQRMAQLHTKGQLMEEISRGQFQDLVGREMIALRKTATERTSS